ncbi:MAG: GYF domain-containing protein [Thermoanaerobaculia bacterium]
MDWHVMAGGQKFGPVSDEELFAWTRAGRVKASDLVWRAGMSDWLPAEKAPELAAVRSSMAAPARAMGEDPAMRVLLPVGRSAWAIAAGYLGLFSLLVVPAPFALFCGIMALREMRRNPKKHGMGRTVFGLVLGGLGTIVLVVLLVSMGRNVF